MPFANRLDNVSIVLVHTKTPANIGSVVRCMMNMGLSRLLLVRPPVDPEREARKLAAGAGLVLDNARSFDTLRDALAGQEIVVGASRQQSRLRGKVRAPRELVRELAPLLPSNRIALVFGNEVNGLENNDLALCNEIVTIPSSDLFPSLNLSHAVLVLAYELFLAANQQPAVQAATLASFEELEGFYDQLGHMLQDTGFLGRDHPERMLFSLRRLFGRARLDSREIRILRGILTRFAKKRSE